MSSDDATIIPLAAGFPTTTRELWRVSADKTLKGGTVDSLARSIEGVRIEPLYSPDGLGAPLTMQPRAGRDRDRPWDVRAPASTHEEVVEALAGGASSVLLKVAAKDIGEFGALLDGVLIDIAPVALDAGQNELAAAEALSSAAKSSPAARLAFHLDPLGAEGDSQVAQYAAPATAVLAEIHPRATLFLANGVRIHDAGGEPAWELAFAIAAGVAYARALTEAGLGAADAFSRVVLALAVDNKPLIGVAKLRAARMMWARVTQACDSPTPANIEARSSHRMLTIADPWSNLVRITQAGFAGAVGGADAIVLYPHDRASGGGDPLGPRYARNASLILMEEAHLGAVDDPAAGAWAFEALTEQLAQDAWAHFNRIESMGGAGEALRSGMIADAVGASISSIDASIAEKKTRIVGVTDFRADAAEPPPEQARATLDPIRLETLAR